VVGCLSLLLPIQSVQQVNIPEINKINLSKEQKEKKEMNRKSIIGLGISLMASLLVAVPALASFEIGYFNDFQQSLDKVVAGSMDSKCIGDSTLKLTFEKGPANMKSTLPSKANGYAELANACGAPVWMMANLTGTGSNLIVEFDAKNVQGCEACIPLVYAGTQAPKYLSQFQADYKGLGAKWDRHTLKVSLAPALQAAIPPAVDAAIGAPQPSTVVAISFTNLDDRAPGLQRIGIDNLSVTLNSAAPPLPPPPAND
jgi:hypothetical protein